jgi:hypothetical protein
MVLGTMLIEVVDIGTALIKLSYNSISRLYYWYYNTPMSMDTLNDIDTLNYRLQVLEDKINKS